MQLSVSGHSCRGNQRHEDWSAHRSGSIHNYNKNASVCLLFARILQTPKRKKKMHFVVNFSAVPQSSENRSGNKSQKEKNWTNTGTDGIKFKTPTSC